MKRFLPILIGSLLLASVSHGGVIHVIGSGATGGGGGCTGYIGSETVDDSGGIGGTYVIMWSYYQPTIAGNVSHIHVSVDANIAEGQKVNAGIYCGDGEGCTGGYSDGDKIGDATAVASTGDSQKEFHLTLDSEIALYDGETYVLAFWTDDTNFYYNYDTETGKYIYYKDDQSISDIDTMPSTLPNSTGSIGSKQYPMWADCSAE